MPDFAGQVVVDVEKRKFDVDGKPFPWYLEDKEPEVKWLRDDLSSVKVTIFAHEGFSCEGIGKSPVIAGIEFPWYITEDGFEYRAARGHVPTVTLAFLARQVLGIGQEDLRPGIYSFNGDRVARGCHDTEDSVYHA